jgi:two-component system nitrogen regulation response regulator NtrX
VIPIEVPPLRDRREDVPLLVRHFTELFARENNFRPKRYTARALDLMQQHRWKGNVRELRNTVERLMIMAPGDVIDEHDLREVLKLDLVEARAGAAPAVAATGDGEPPGAPAGGPARPATLREFKESTERAFLVRKLKENAWNISRTAEVIGTPRSNLYKKLEQYGINQESDG